MFYQLLLDYTHHGGQIKNLSIIPKGTLISKEPFRETTGMEYVSCSYGDSASMYLSAEVVENNPKFFKKLTEEEYLKILTKLKLKNKLYQYNEILTIEEMYDVFNEAFVEIQLDPKEEFRKRMKELTEMIKDKNEIQTPFSPNQTMPLIHNNICHCGNDGTKPCFSTGCPRRIIISYGSGTAPHTGSTVCTYSYTINNRNNKENNDR